ncbi:hypothetical protein AB0D10_25735 [Kitasatospora sp. NPDC048545]|uniref:hypothetical protein n=1 Tax=Kitasatospora sp. NPDC048545 TaxID=3157208 RepID=UPI0033F2EA5F
MTPAHTTATRMRTTRPTTGPHRTTEPRTHGGAAPVRVVPLWAAPCALAAQDDAKR